MQRRTSTRCATSTPRRVAAHAATGHAAIFWITSCSLVACIFGLQTTGNLIGDSADTHMDWMHHVRSHVGRSVQARRPDRTDRRNAGRPAVLRPPAVDGRGRRRGRQRGRRPNGQAARHACRNQPPAPDGRGGRTGGRATAPGATRSVGGGVVSIRGFGFVCAKRPLSI